MIAKTDTEKAKSTATLVVQMWARYILRVSRDKKIAFTYLANDLIQRSSPKKKPDCDFFFHAFAPPVISDVLVKMIEILN